MVEKLSHLWHLRKSFTAMEVLIVASIIVVMAALSVPVYRQYLIRSDLDIAQEQTEQALRRALILSQAGEHAAQWGVSVPDGILFRGSSYEGRNPDHDELFHLPPTITVIGIQEVAFSPLDGVPSVTGDIILEAMNGDQRVIPVSGIPVPVPPLAPVRIKLVFDRIKNQGSGNATNEVYVGEEGVIYLENQWIPLTDGDEEIDDDGIKYFSPGIAVERDDDYLRVLAHGELPHGGKEIIDVRVIFDGGTISNIKNDYGDHETENPFDENVNDGVGGDEVTVAGNNRSVLFQTRVTNAGDAILIYWDQDDPPSD